MSEQEIIAEYEAQLAERDARIAALEAENAALRERLEALERRLGMDSTNSSKPPSTDDEKTRAQRKRRVGGRKPGGQRGHKGVTRAMLAPEDVDHIHEHLPARCACGHPLGPEHLVGPPIRSQTWELPAKLVECHEHRRHAARCPACKQTTRASLPPDARTGWGPRTSALVATLTCTLGASRRALHELLTDVFAIPSSLGTIERHLADASAALAPLHAQAKAAVHRARYLGADETGWREGRLPRWAWLMQCDEAAYLELRERRDKASAQALLADAQAEVIITDRYGAYSWLDPSRRQVCRAHLLREWQGLSERAGPVGERGAELVDAERELAGKHRRWRDGALEWAAFVEEARGIRARMEGLCAQLLEADEGVACARWFIGASGAMAWTFMNHPTLALTNNASERDLRPLVLLRKRAFGSKTPDGMRLISRLFSVRLTSIKQRKSFFSTIFDALHAHLHASTPPLLV